MLTKTLNLIRSINSGSIAKEYINELSGLARVNKVLLGFLRRIGYEGSLRIIEERCYRQYMENVVKVSKALNGLDYALFKFRKPIEHVSVDIDILVHSKHLWDAVKKLRELDFRIEVSEPYTVTMVKGKTIVDLYTHPSFTWIVYLNGERLLEEVETISIDIGGEGMEVKALTMEAEVIASATHAIYKEHMYLLSDYYVIKQWLNRKALKLAEELNAKEAILISLGLNNQIEQGLIEMPIKLDLAQIAKILTMKFMKDSNFRTTSMNAIKLITRKRTIKQLISRIKRKSY